MQAQRKTDLFALFTPAPREDCSIITRNRRIQISHMDIQGSSTMSKIPYMLDHLDITVVTVTYVGWAVEDKI